MKTTDKEKMSYFLDSLHSICKQYNVKIEALLDSSIGTPHAVARFVGTDNYYNVETDDLEHTFGEEIEL